MAKVIVWNLMTLEGFFEGGEKWDLDFHGDAWGDELSDLSSEFGRKAGLLVFGRVTYEGMKAYWTSTQEEGETKTFMNALPKLVASRSHTGSDWNNTTVTGDIVGEIRRRKARPGKDIYVFGSAELTESLLAAGLGLQRLRDDELRRCGPGEGDGSRGHGEAEGKARSAQGCSPMPSRLTGGLPPKPAMLAVVSGSSLLRQRPSLPSTKPRMISAKESPVGKTAPSRASSCETGPLPAGTSTTSVSAAVTKALEVRRLPSITRENSR